jgi:hypothetical protein
MNIEGKDASNSAAFFQLTKKLKCQLLNIPKEKTEKLFQRKSQFNKLNFQYLKLL